MERGCGPLAHQVQMFVVLRPPHQRRSQVDSVPRRWDVRVLGDNVVAQNARKCRVLRHLFHTHRVLHQLRTERLVEWQHNALLQCDEQVRVKAYEEEGDGRVHGHVPLVALMLCRRSDQPLRRLVRLHQERRVPKRERYHNVAHMPRDTLAVATKRILRAINLLCPRKLHVVRIPTVVLERHNQHVHGRQQEGGRP